MIPARPLTIIVDHFLYLHKEQIFSSQNIEKHFMYLVFEYFFVL